METSGSCGCHSSYATLARAADSSSQLSVDMTLDDDTGVRRRQPMKQPMADVGLDDRFMNRRGCPHAAYESTHFEHIANTLSHGVGIAPGMYAIYLLQTESRTNYEALVLLVYGIGIVMLFTCSTAYHTAEMLFRPHKRSMRFWLHVCDRAGIYIYIAAGYTPWLFLRDAGWLGIYMRYIVWTSAALGCLYQYVFHERYKTVETLLYIAIGGCPAVVLCTMSDWSGMWPSLLGGVCYIVGVGFFKSDGVVPFAHAIWHLHVLGGALCQFIAIYFYLLDDASRLRNEQTIMANN